MDDERQTLKAGMLNKDLKKKWLDRLNAEIINSHAQQANTRRGSYVSQYTERISRYQKDRRNQENNEGSELVIQDMSEID